MWVTERKPKTSAEVAKLADDYYLSARKQNGSRLGQERKFDQKAGKKTTVSESSFKQGSEPKGEDAPRTAVGKRSSKREIRCFNCRDMAARDCPSNALFGGEQGMLGIKHRGIVEDKYIDGYRLFSNNDIVAGRLGAQRKATGKQRCNVSLCSWGYGVVSYSICT